MYRVSHQGECWCTKMYLLIFGYFRPWTSCYSSLNLLPFKTISGSVQNKIFVIQHLYTCLLSLKCLNSWKTILLLQTGCTSPVLTIKAIHTTIKSSPFQTAQLLGNTSVHPEWSTKWHIKNLLLKSLYCRHSGMWQLQMDFFPTFSIIYTPPSL